MNIIIALIITLSSSTIETGIASQYAPGVMERVIENRQFVDGLPQELPLVDGFIAALDCDDFKELWFVKPDGGEWGIYMVVDCGGPDTSLEWWRENNILLEFDHLTVMRLGMVGRGVPVQVVRP